MDEHMSVGDAEQLMELYYWIGYLAGMDLLGVCQHFVATR